MSQQQWQQPPGPGDVGSVRKARKRAEAGLPPEIAQPPRQRPYEVPRAGPNQPLRPRPQGPAGFTGSRNGQGQVGVAISRPTQVPQWPLAGANEGGDGRNNQYQPPAGRGLPPQRPPRPSHVPSMLDASRLQEHTPSFQYQGVQSPEQQYHGGFPEDNVMSPDTISPMTASSRPSTVSSVGTIPDFPVPAIPQGPPGQTRRSANLGPPPTSRRGASSYYSQASFVSPIPEESPRTTIVPSHQSYASSAAMPNNYWGPESPGYQSDEFNDYYDKEKSEHTIEEGRESRGSNGDDSDDRGLIRSASLGKRAKPSMVTTRSFDRAEQITRPVATPKQVQTQASKSKLERMGVIDGAAGPEATTAVAMTASKIMMGGQRQTVWPTVGNPDSPLAGGTGLIDKTPSSSEESVPTLLRPAVAKGMESVSASAEPNSNPILGAYNAASSLSPGPTPVRTPSPGFGRLSAIRRPPRLDIDAVRDAEARGSLTSLPDLIRRATKLAAMMDRGKRPGSRMNDLSDFPSDIDLSLRNKEYGKRNSGLSGMLSAFPPPGLGTPRDGTPRPQSSWPSPFGGSHEKDDSGRQKRPGRRCCGMPCWVFLLLLLGLLIVIAAAVVVPIYFLIIKKNTTAAPPSALQKCQQDTATACQNGGMSSLSTGSCSCICINGFTGSTCTISDQGACTAITLTDSSVSNATLGDAIPRLITASQSNFSIPLREQVILARFNTADLSCVSQNALVTFDGQAKRVGSANAIVKPSLTDSESVPTETAASNNRRRQASTTTSSASPVGTANGGIIFDPTVSSGPASLSGSSSLPATALFNITQEVLDFARVSVLFVLQEETLDNAVNAQTNLQRFFGLSSFTNGAASNVSLGNGNLINLLDFKLNLGEGAVGGKNTTSSSKRSFSRIGRELWSML